MLGEGAVQQMLDSALEVAERCGDQNDREAINKVVSDVRSMVDALNELKATGQVCVNVFSITGKYVFINNSVKKIQ